MDDPTNSASCQEGIYEYFWSILRANNEGKGGAQPDHGIPPRKAALKSISGKMNINSA
jgi:hypothetical protein